MKFNYNMNVGFNGKPLFRRRYDMAKRVTMEMIAKACDTSIGTVDRALNSRKGINAETRQRIMDKAEELGYRPNITKARTP